jgi:hypothetical protein
LLSPAARNGFPRSIAAVLGDNERSSDGEVVEAFARGYASAG